jgi:hypothetical protein
MISVSILPLASAAALLITCSLISASVSMYLTVIITLTHVVPDFTLLVYIYPVGYSPDIVVVL